jgi:dienelactone hydrolase
VVPEAEFEQTEAGLVPAGAGWFVMNARDARWFHRPGRDSLLFLYPGDRHLFADNSLADYDESAATMLKQRVLSFLDDLE